MANGPQNEFTGKRDDEIPSAARQFSVAIIEARRSRARGLDLRTSYQTRKAGLLAGAHGLPAGVLQTLLFWGTETAENGQEQQSLRVGVDILQNNERLISPAIKLALLASTTTVDPFAGILAFSPLPKERSFWHPRTKALYRSAAAYMAETADLLAGLLCISFPVLDTSAITDERLVELGLTPNSPD